MKALITTSLLLLLIHLHYARADDVNWAECDDTAYCQEWPSEDCKEPTETLQIITASSIKKRNPPLPYCNIGVHIKPVSTKKWTISIMHDKLEASEPFTWLIGTAKVFKCDHNVASSMDGRLQVEAISTRTAKGKFLCVFTVSSVQSDKMVSTILEAIKADELLKKIPGDTELHFGSTLTMYITYSFVNKKLRCDGSSLFKENACDEKTEDCTKVKNEESWGCQDGYISRYRNGEGDYETSKIKCINGEFIRLFNNSENIIETKAVEAESTAKCARRKCAQCKAKTNFASLLKEKEETDFECSTLECNSGYLVINGTKGVIAVKSGDPVMCSDKTIVKPNKDSEEKHARWVVDGHDDIVIETAVCMETFSCDLINELDTDCGNSENCVKAEFNADTQLHECKNGTAHIFVNKTDIPISQPVCTEGKWIIITENSTEPLAFNSGDKIMMKCIYQPVISQKASASPAKSSFPIWIVFVIVFIVLLTIGIGIATYFYRKGRAAKKASMVSKTSKTSKTPSSSNPSANAPTTSSGEKEPLTSAIGNSITGDSLHTAIPAKPTVVLAKADLRASTAAVSSDTSTNKEKKKRDIKESIPDLDDADEKKREKTCASDETSKKWKKSDMTSTKEKLAPMPGGSTDDALKSQTGGDGESLVSTKKNQESAKLLPKNRATPRKYSKSSTKGKDDKKKSSNKEFLNLTDSDEDEPSKTGSKRKGKKRK